MKNGNMKEQWKEDGDEERLESSEMSSHVIW